MPFERHSASSETTAVRRSKRGPPLQLEYQLTIAKLVEFELQFTEIAANRGPGKPSGRGLDIDEFRSALREVVGDHVTDEEADAVFWKVDVNYEEAISWQVEHINVISVAVV
jgi:hypothetical protein